MRIIAKSGLITQAEWGMRAFATAICISFMVANAYADNAAPPPKDLSKPYTERQTYKEGQQSFYKDNNVWVYTPAFAKTFGMPSENIYPELKGIEAAAYRIEDPGYRLCGMGGKEENCMTQYRCVTDVYIDESKYPLPWATNNQADWYAAYNSLLWLQTKGEIGFEPKLPEGIISDEASRAIHRSSLHPFADPDTHRLTILFENSNTPYPEYEHSNMVRIFGYSRRAIAGLTMVTLDYNCLSRNSQKKVVTFRLADWKLVNHRKKFIKIYYEFQLPDEFHKKIDARLKEKQERDKVYYLQLLNQLNQK